MQALSPLKSRRISDGRSDVTWLAQHGTLADFSFEANPTSEFHVGRLDNQSYYPVSVQFLRDCTYESTATCLSLSPNASVRISRGNLKVALYSWLFALGSGAGVGMRGSISARVAALYANHASIMELCITSAFCTRS